ncbi:hypothetical protein Tco_0935750 [Tanacetum coccineum]
MASKKYYTLDTVMSDSEDSTVTYTTVSSPFADFPDIGSPGVGGPPMMPEDPYARGLNKAYEIPPPTHIPLRPNLGALIYVMLHAIPSSISNKCLADENLVILLEEIQLDDKLHFIEEPVEIMDREVKQLKQSRIPIVKVRWNSRRGQKITWEREDFFIRKYPHLFPSKKRRHGDNRAPRRRSRKERRM